MTNLPTVSPDEIPFDQMLAYAMAENRVAMLNKPWTEDELCEQFDITIDVLQQLKQSKKFAKAVTMAVSELKKGSGAIETKAKSLFEMYTDTWVPQVMSNPDAMLSEKVKIYTLLGKTGKVLQENAKAAEGAQTVVPQFNLILTQAAPVAVQPIMKDLN
jgi:hypothetical protein